MRKGVCKICGGDSGVEVLSLADCSDTYLDYLNIGYADEPRSFLKCKNCGTIFRDPMLTEEEKVVLYRHFRDQSLRNENGKQYFKRITGLSESQSENYDRNKFLGQYIGATGSMMDVGAGYGVFIYSFLKSFGGWKAIGIEPTDGVSQVAEEHGVKIHETYLKDGMEALFSEEFDLITVNHVLEHVDEPKVFLKMISKYLGDDGLLYVEVPSAEDIGFLPKQHDRFMCQHEMIFDGDSLALLIREVGMRIIKMENFLSKRGRNNLRVICHVC